MDNEYALDRMLEDLEAQGYKAPERNPELDAVDELVASDELDVRVAQALGMVEYPHDFMDNGSGSCSQCDAHCDPHSWRVTGPQTCSRPPAFSFEIEPAWMVLEHMHKLGWGLFFGDMRLAPDIEPKERLWWYELNRWDDPEAKIDGVQFGNHNWELDGGGKTLQEAICHAMLKVAILSKPVEGFVEDSQLE